MILFRKDTLWSGITTYIKDLEIMGDESEPKTSVEELLNRYRDKLLSTYDII